MFRRQRRPKLSRQQIENAIRAVKQLGQPPATPRHGKPLGDAVRALDRKS